MLSFLDLRSFLLLFVVLVVFDDDVVDDVVDEEDPDTLRRFKFDGFFPIFLCFMGKYAFADYC